MNLDLSNRTAIVCGSTQGLGWASAYELALLGANIVLMARNESALKEKLTQLPNNGQQLHDYIVADFTDSKMVENNLVQWLKKGYKAEILVNNTGGPASGKILGAKSEEFSAAFESHLLCNHILVQHLVPAMKQANFGRIVNIISTSVKTPLANLGVSNTIRAAVANWSKTLAGELAPFAITVNNVLPGFTQTARADYIIKKRAADSGKTEAEVLEELQSDIPVGRIGKPEEFGAAVAFLCSPAAAYITGINLPVDGGRLQCL